LMTSRAGKLNIFHIFNIGYQKSQYLATANEFVDSQTL